MLAVVYSSYYMIKETTLDDAVPRVISLSRSLFLSQLVGGFFEVSLLRGSEDSSLPFGPFPMSRSEPTSPKRSRTDETTVVDYPTGTFKARAPAVHACRAHDKKRLCTDQIHSSTRAHLHPDARQCPHRTDPEMTTGTR